MAKLATMKVQAQERRAKMLELKYKDKKDTEKYHIKYLICVIATWVVGTLSAVTAASALFIYFEGILNWQVAAIIAVTLAVLYELFRRSEYTNYYEDYYASQGEKKNIKAAVTLVALFGVGAALSAWGINESIKKYHPQADLINFDEKAKLVQTQLDGVLADIELYQTNEDYRTSKGELDWNVRTKTLPSLREQQTSLETELRDIQKSIEAENGVIGTNHAAIVQGNAHMGLYGMIAFELILIMTFNYKEKYEYAEFEEVQGKSNGFQQGGRN